MPTLPYTTAPLPANETERIAALHDLATLDQPRDLSLDDLTALAAQICGTPIALISLVDADRQWFKASVGLEERQTPRDLAFCAHAILQTETFIVENTLADERFRQNPLVVQEPKVRFYAGAQLRTAGGFNVGTLCVLDTQPRKLTDQQRQSLEVLARQVVLNFERHQLAADQVRREAFLQRVLAMIPDTVSYIDADYVYRYVNPAYKAWFSLEPKEMVGCQVADVLGPTVFAQVGPALKRAMNGERQAFTTQLPLGTQQGGDRLIEALYVPDLDADGRVVGLYAVARDVTQLKLAEEEAIFQGEKLAAALAKSVADERLLRTMFDYSPIGLIKIDTSLRYLSVNAAFSRFIGYSEDELKGKTILDVTHPSDLQRTAQHAADFPAGDGYLHRYEKRYIHRLGHVIWGMVTSRAMPPDESGRRYLFTVIEDISDVKAKELELKAAQASLIGTAKMASLGEMASGIAHEINNPLAIISGKSDVLCRRMKKGPVDPERIMADLVIIRQTSERIAKIVRGLRTFSRDGQYDPMELVSIKMILVQTTDLCFTRYQSAGVELRVACPDDLQLECRPTQVSQILMNLLSNAFDAVKDLPSPWVQVDVIATGANVEVRVTDAGLGIAAATAERMMEPFFTTKDVGAGTGLGLSLASSMAQSHQGQVRYLADAANTCFVLDLPLRQAKSTSQVA